MNMAAIPEARNNDLGFQSQRYNVADESLRITFSYDGSLHPYSGVSNYVLTLGEYLTSRGHQVSYMVADSHIDNPDVRAVARTVFLPANGSRSGESLPASRQILADTLEELAPDVLHSQLPFNPMASGRGLQYLRPETARIGTFHSLPETTVSKLAVRGIAQLTKGRIAQFDRTFSASEALQNQVARAYGVTPTLLPLPVDVAKLEAGTKLSEFNDDKVNMVFLGGLEPRKGCHHLLGALSLLDTDTRNHMRLLVGGDGPMKPKLERFIVDNTLQDTVEFLGNVSPEDKPNLFATSNIAVFPAVHGESFGLVLAEAMAATSGVVIGGNNAGYSYALGHQKEALFNPTDYAETAEFLKSLMKSDVLRHKIKASQKQLVKDYDIKVIGPVIEDAYTQASDSKLARQGA